jgi:AraC-like DNA-binding protein
LCDIGGKSPINGSTAPGCPTKSDRRFCQGIRMNVASAIIEAADLRLRAPVPCLRTFLGCFWSITTAAGTRLRSLPDGCPMLSVERPVGKRPKCFLTGPRLVPTEGTPEAGCVLFGVRLRPGVAFLLTKRAVSEITDRQVQLGLLVPDDAPRLEKRMASVEGAEEGLDMLEEFLLQRLNGSQIDKRLENALRHIENSEGQIRITELANDCGVSPRHLGRLFRTWTGLSPKRMTRILRFQALLQRAGSPRPAALADIATELGYYDQSHLANEVAQFTAARTMQVTSRYVADFSKTRCE